MLDTDEGARAAGDLARSHRSRDRGLIHGAIAPMFAWRPCRAPFADLSGDGARLYGGRWNTPGRPVVCMASTAALAVLEVRVHLDLPFDPLPDDYGPLTVDLDQPPVEPVAEMPANPRIFGDAWLRGQRTPVLQTPSAIVPENPNFLLNPDHRSSGLARVIDRRSFAFDPRLWRPV